MGGRSGECRHEWRFGSFAVTNGPRGCLWMALRHAQCDRSASAGPAVQRDCERGYGADHRAPVRRRHHQSIGRRDRRHCRDEDLFCELSNGFKRDLGHGLRRPEPAPRHTPRQHLSLAAHCTGQLAPCVCVAGQSGLVCLHVFARSEPAGKTLRRGTRREDRIRLRHGRQTARRSPSRPRVPARRRSGWPTRAGAIFIA